jgi:hypothetical protein
MVAAGADVPVDPPPPPTPFERAGARRRRWPVVVTALVLALGGAWLLRGGTLDLRVEAGLGAPAATDPGEDAGADPGPQAEDAVLLALLRAIDRAEAAMLTFGADARAVLEGAPSRADGLSDVAAAAAVALATLEEERSDLEVPRPTGGPEDVRAAYLPHLDAWIAYLAAVAADPEELFAGPSDPAILRINATARVFADALAAVLAAGVGPEAERLGRDILTEGFPAQEDADL